MPAHRVVDWDGVVRTRHKGRRKREGQPCTLRWWTTTPPTCVSCRRRHTRANQAPATAGDTQSSVCSNCALQRKLLDSAWRLLGTEPYPPTFRAIWAYATTPKSHCWCGGSKLRGGPISCSQRPVSERNKQPAEPNLMQLGCADHHKFLSQRTAQLFRFWVLLSANGSGQ